MRLWTKRLILLFVFLFSYLALAVDPIWTDSPIQYKRHYEVQTFLFWETPNQFGGLGYYATYIFDQRYPNSLHHIQYQVFSGVESHALIAHRTAVQWLVDNHAHLRVIVPENHEYIGVSAPTPPSAPRSGRRSFTIPDPEPQLAEAPVIIRSMTNGTLPVVDPRIRSNPTTKRARTEPTLDNLAEETDEDLKREMMSEMKGSF
jgi:hypothetical protein